MSDFTYAFFERLSTIVSYLKGPGPTCFTARVRLCSRNHPAGLYLMLDTPKDSFLLQGNNFQARLGQMYPQSVISADASPPATGLTWATSSEELRARTLPDQTAAASPVQGLPAPRLPTLTAGPVPQPHLGPGQRRGRHGSA